jgi:hypothetical protein
MRDVGADDFRHRQMRLEEHQYANKLAVFSGRDNDLGGRVPIP